MFRVATKVALLLTLAAGTVYAGDDDDKKRADRRMLSLEKRAKKIPRLTDADDNAGFLAQETDRLIERSRAFSRSSYEFDRMLEALDDLLDAREQLAEASRNSPDPTEEKGSRRDTAKRLERAYFRVQQGEYFARLSGEQQGPEYVRRARQLYQKGRAAYDAHAFRRANKLASASSELVNVLENLAQAAVRRPDPPVLD